MTISLSTRTRTVTARHLRTMAPSERPSRPRLIVLVAGVVLILIVASCGPSRTGSLDNYDAAHAVDRTTELRGREGLP